MSGETEASDAIEGSGTGSIVLVATPIGNLGDLSPRAVETLAGAQVIYCEDTRHSRKLLTHSGITGPTLRSLHEHNEDERVDQVLREVAAGRTVAVISDAGMPGISDPGSRLVAAAAESGATVSVVPGPSSVLAALVVSGLPTERFCFEGFLPRSGRDRRRRLEQLAGEERTTVVFEAPGRVAGTLDDLAQCCGGNRRVALARELTKLHEEIWRGSLDEARTWAGASTVRGEVVLVIEGASPVAPPVVEDAEVVSAIAAQVAAGERTRGAVDAVAAQFGIPRRRVYDLALASKGAAADPDDRNEQPGDRVEP
ncbi:MAG TPA: 16S rRNA (cytidine(1402)-2'-O)-methyltransferase [Acidimicrobiales bacterium]|jgi:16S rRNA (cytidine1402-2'-O)-methyltransferase|nr:16S rRNA (cytidine(1402)-2'-O)-methyltransferase [Acidimicrobiales bacterium]